MNNKQKVSKEVAEQEFQRFVDEMDIEADTAAMDKDDLKGFNEQKDRIVSSIVSGHLVVNDNGEPVYTPRRTPGVDSITFHEPTGASLMAMDRKKKSEDVGKLYATMGDMTKTHANVFAKMKMADLKVCMAVATLFLA